jgi:endonuclease/exonuclease/phosphatase family metal-dependent hydrolase
MVAQVVRIEIDGHVVDVYVTHLYRCRGDDALRLYQVQQLLAWIDSRDDVEARVVCGDFNATLEMPSAQLMARVFRPTQTAPTAFTPLQDTDGTVSHPYWPRFDRCIDYIWVADLLAVRASGVCFNTPSATDPTLWPSDHAGVWADLAFSETSRSAQQADGGQSRSRLDRVRSRGMAGAIPRSLGRRQLDVVIRRVQPSQ